MRPSGDGSPPQLSLDACRAAPGRLAALPEEVRDRYRQALAAAEKHGYAVGLHILPDLRLQELALIVRSAEVRSTRLGAQLRPTTHRLSATLAEEASYR